MRKLLLILCLALAGGCSHSESRVLDRLPAPLFGQPATEWPATQPQVDRAADDREAAWRNHVLPGRDWQWVVIHHSATPGGNAAKFDTFHREQRGWNELGYDFVIGNGSDSRDGQVEVGPRWIAQRQGAHCLTPSGRFNKLGVGVCLVGDFEQTQPTPAQWRSAVELVEFLCREYRIAPDHILGHRDAQATEGQPQTSCPGRLFDLGRFRRDVATATAARASP